jgi:GNAT superfamily N-acetyltransferase
MKQAPYNIREAETKDVPFIFNSWLKSYRNSNFARPLENTIYFSEHHKVIERVLQHHGVIIACNPEDPSQIYGFLCAGYVDGILVLHYAYVKQPFRKLGIAKALLNCLEQPDDSAILYTHQTRVAQTVAPRYNMIYHPYLAYDLAAYLGLKNGEDSEADKD